MFVMFCAQLWGHFENVGRLLFSLFHSERSLFISSLFHQIKPIIQKNF